MMLLSEMKYPEVEAYLKLKRTIIVPCGSHEQHGPFAPLGTDSMIAMAIASEAGRRTDTMVAPVLAYGFSPGLHSTFTGTISLRGSTYMAFVEDVLDSLFRSGFKEILFLTGHGMNMSPLQTVVADYLDKNDGRIIVADYWNSPLFTRLQEEGEGSHATISEISMMLYLFPKLVDMTKAVNEMQPIPYYMGKNEVHKISQSGVIAKATQADAQKGKDFFAAAVEATIELLERFRG